MNIQSNVSLKKYSTFNIGGVSRYLCEVDTINDLCEALIWARTEKQKVFIIGGGSNILFGDGLFDGLVVRLKNQNIGIKKEGRRMEIVCGAGVEMSELIDCAAHHGVTGLEWATGIPGTFGGAIRGNIGAFGGEIKDVLNSVKVLDMAFDQSKTPPQLSTLTNSQCEFDYRWSIIKSMENLVVWEGSLHLTPGEPDEIYKSMETILSRRLKKQPELTEFPSIGSIFKNPDATIELVEMFERDQGIDCRGSRVPAGWLIEKCNLKGKTCGGAMISEKQGNFIVNYEDATAKDVMSLILSAKEAVQCRFGVALEEEVKILAGI